MELDNVLEKQKKYSNSLEVIFRIRKNNLPKFCCWKNRALLFTSSCNAFTSGLLLNGNKDDGVAAAAAAAPRKSNKFQLRIEENIV